MKRYKIEGNLNFYDELYKSLDDCDDDETNVCQITGLPLNNKYVKLECKHTFNYEALYKEICRQKYDFKTYNTYHLSKVEQKKLRHSMLNYFIRCPYCRNIQFTILPYYEELGLEKRYGINSLDKTLQDSEDNYICKSVSANLTEYNYTKYGVTFKYGTCLINHCKSTFVAFIPNTIVSYCGCHYFSELKIYKKVQKQKLLEEKNILKEQILNDRNKLFQERNIEREKKGLPPLKRLPNIKKNIKNVVEHQNSEIQQYIPEETNDIPQETNDIPQETNGCTAMLKTGKNKGTKCGCKKIETDGLCKRHSKEKISV
jgi:hypothetical protein